ncbi:hypothetical protein Tco_0305586 [Tanacetum coccineum]
MIQKHIEKEKVRQLTIMNLAVEFENASIAKDDMRKAYEECKDILEEKRALIDIYLKEESDKDYEMHNALNVFAFRVLFFQSLFCMAFFVKQIAYGDDSFLTSGIVYITLFLNKLFDFFNVPKVDDVSLVDRVFDGAFGGDGEEDFVMEEVEAMEVRYEGDEDDKKNVEDEYLI